MLKKILAVMVMMYAAVSFAAVDVNKATAAELDAVKGVGPSLSAKIIKEKAKAGDFKDWNDLVTRVKGIGEKNAVKLSAEGLTVGAETYKGAAAKPSAKKADKPMPAKDAKPAATDAKTDAKPAAAKAEAPKTAAEPAAKK